jgi:hypothetical protein
MEKIVEINGTFYLLGDPVEPDTSNLEFGEKYIEHTQVNPDRYSLWSMDDEITIENSWKIKAQSKETHKGIPLFDIVDIKNAQV